MMKKLNLLIGLILLSYWCNAQNLMGSYWNGTNEISRHQAVTTGAFTNLAIITGASSIVQGESAFDVAGNRYFETTSQGITIMDATTGTVIAVVNTTVNIGGMEYNPATGDLVGTYSNGTSEVYASVNISTGVVTNIATLSGPTSYVQGESSFDAAGNRYFNNTNIGISALDATTGAVLNTISNSSFRGPEFNPTTGKLVGTVWNGTDEVFTTLDISTGVATSIATLTGAQSVAQGETTFDASGNVYYFVSNLGTMAIDASTGAVLNTIPTMYSMEFIGGSSSSSPCNLSAALSSAAQVNVSSGGTAAFSASSNLPGSSFQWLSNPCNIGWVALSNNSTYSGATSANLNVSGVALGNQLQKFRAVVSNGGCTDTTSIGTIHLADTCIVIVRDTVHVTVTDSLIIDLLLTGVQQNVINVVRVYPNPATTNLTIDNGDYSKMVGYSIKILNIAGQQVFAQAVTQKIMNVDLSLMTAKGVYLLQIVDAANTVIETKKVLIQ